MALPQRLFLQNQSIFKCDRLISIIYPLDDAVDVLHDGLCFRFVCWPLPKNKVFTHSTNQRFLKNHGCSLPLNISGALCLKWNHTKYYRSWEAIGWTDGDSVSLNDDGHILAVGLKGRCVRVYQWVQKWIQSGRNGWSEHIWTRIGADIDYGTVENDETGHSVSLNREGTVIALGAPGFDDYRGQVRVFKWNETAWGPLGGFIDGEYGYPHPFGPSGAPDEFGHVVELNKAGDVVSVSSFANSENGEEAGHVRVFRLDGNDWIQMGADIDAKGAMDRTGVAMSLNEDGTIVAIGAEGNKSTRIFRYDGNDWNQLGSDIESSGRAVAINGDGYTVAVQSPGENIVRILHFNQTHQPTPSQTAPS